MVIGRITSGLGNQLFQYALARTLALRNHTSLYLDLSYYKQTYATNTPRTFKLDRFNVRYERLETSPYVYLSKATKLLPNRSLKPFAQFVREPHFHFGRAVLEAKAKLIVLEGFWQSERYFGECASVIRDELSFKRQVGPAFDSYRRMIQQAELPISIHIRRGDYVTHPEFSQSFGFVGLAYYQQAIRMITNRFPSATLFVFSDDMDWVRHNLSLNLPHVFVNNTGADADVDDLESISLCHHHVIANSSFSWWGAWLNPRADKVVVAPNQWFKNKPDWNTRDLVPPGWLRL